jgi:hypothetical protein
VLPPLQLSGHSANPRAVSNQRVLRNWAAPAHADFAWRHLVHRSPPDGAGNNTESTACCRAPRRAIRNSALVLDSRGPHRRCGCFACPGPVRRASSTRAAESAGPSVLLGCVMCGLWWLWRLVRRLQSDLQMVYRCGPLFGTGKWRTKLRQKGVTQQLRDIVLALLCGPENGLRLGTGNRFASVARNGVQHSVVAAGRSARGRKNNTNMARSTLVKNGRSGTLSCSRRGVRKSTRMSQCIVRRPVRATPTLGFRR